MNNIESLGRDIIIYGRNPDNTVYKTVDRNFQPYFYIPDDNGEFTSIYGDKLKKIVISNPNDVFFEVRNYSVTFEGDVNYRIRYIIDKIEKLEKEPLRILYIDIEVDSSNGFPVPELAKMQMLSIGLYDSFDKEYIVYYLGLDDYDISDCKLIKCTTEQEMLTKFLDYLKEKDPDIISGWNVDFDAYYIYNRMKNLNMNTNLLSRDRYNCYDNVKQKKVKFFGRFIFDLLEAYKIMIPDSRENYRLDTIGDIELGFGKHKFKGDLTNLYLTDKRNFLYYNMTDVKILVELDAKRHIINFFDELRRFVKCRFEDCFARSMMNDVYILNYAHKKGLIMPSKISVEHTEYEGAIVKRNVDAGIYNNVASLDFASLYPSCILSCNMSPETFKLKTEITDEELQEYICLENGVCFDKNVDGLVPSIIKELFELRKNYRGEMRKYDMDSLDYNKFNSMQYSCKILLNCFSDDTKILTVDGTKNIKDCKVGDLVYSMNPDTLELEKKKIIRTYKYRYNGDMYHFNSKSCDLLVTPNHKFLVESQYGRRYFNEVKDWKFNDVIPIHKALKQNIKKYINLLDYVNYDDYEKYIFKKNIDLRILKRQMSKYEVKFKKVNGKKCGIECSKDVLVKLFNDGYDIRVCSKRFHTKYTKVFVLNKDFSNFLGWFLSEGSIYSSISKQFGNFFRGVSHKIQISQDIGVNNGNRMKICNTFRNLGIDYKKYKKSILFCSDLYYDILKFCGKRKDKHIPEFLLIIIDKKEFFKTAYFGDGHKNATIYSTYSDKFKEQLLCILVELGYRVKVYNREYDKYINRIVFSNKTHSFDKENLSVIKNNSNYVYCVEVEDNHTLIAGRNEKYCWTGQSLYGLFGFSGSRIYNRLIADSVTLMARNVILHSEKTATQFGYKIAYIDTDSLFAFIDIKSDEVEKIVAEGFVLCDLVNNSLAYFCKQNHNIDRHYFKIQYEKFYSEIYFASVLKRYFGYLIWKEDVFLKEKKFHMMGFEGKRKDTPKVSQDMQKELFKMILDRKSKEDIKVFLDNFINKVRTVYIPEEIALPISYGRENYKNNPINMRAINFSNEYFDMDIRLGDRVKYLFVTRFNKYRTDVVAIKDELPSGFVVDYQQMLRRILWLKVAPVLNSLGYRDLLPIKNRVKIKEKNRNIFEYMNNSIAKE